MLASSSSSYSYFAFILPFLKILPCNLVHFEHHVLYSKYHLKNRPTVLLPMTFLNWNPFFPLHQDELKKLYSQLEVHKTKRMANSNPHLPKKRSSRLSIGRSLIKRITEIPESLSRQCSREDKDVSAAIGTITRSGSYYRCHQTTSINTMNETLMQPSPKLQKSHSAYDYTPEREVSLLNCSIKSKTDRRASQQSDAGSIKWYQLDPLIWFLGLFCDSVNLNQNKCNLKQICTSKLFFKVN